MIIDLAKIYIASHYRNRHQTYKVHVNSGETNGVMMISMICQVSARKWAKKFAYPCGPSVVRGMPKKSSPWNGSIKEIWSAG